MSIDSSSHRELVAHGALLLDVRTPAEFCEGHLAQAVNVPVQELPARICDVGPTSRPVVVYCRSGSSSISIAFGAPVPLGAKA